MNIVNTIANMSSAGKIATSLVAKDMVGCYLYVSQARKNREMSVQQRSDVANYDLANGIINIGLQLLAIKPVEKVMKTFVESNWLKNTFANFDERIKDIRPENHKVLSSLVKNKNKVLEGGVALLSVIICQYFIKRMVSPYLSVSAGEKSKQLGIIKPKIYADDDPKEIEEYKKRFMKKA